MTDLTSLNVSGVPITGFGIPATFGTVFYVDADLGSDSYDGLNMRAEQGGGPKKTVAAGYALMTTDKNDVLVMSAVSAHSLSTELTVEKNRVHFLGLGLGSRYFGQRCRWEMGVTTGAEVALLQNTGVGNTFTNIKMRSMDTNSSYCLAEGGEFSQFENCSFEHGALLGTAGTSEVLCNGDTPLFLRCGIGSFAYTLSDARNGVQFARETILGKFARDVEFNDCRFVSRTSVTTNVNVRATENDIERGCLFKDCMFTSSGDSTDQQALAFGVASALLRVQISIVDSPIQNITDICATSLGVYTNSASATAAANDMILVATG